MEEITGMIKDGVYGTAHDQDNGYLPILKSLGGMGDAQKYYQAAKLYNSGIHSGVVNLSVSISATACYASDVANRLTGWSLSAKGCQ
jgi:hypothetical protein